MRNVAHSSSSSSSSSAQTYFQINICSVFLHYEMLLIVQAVLNLAVRISRASWLSFQYPSLTGMPRCVALL